MNRRTASLTLLTLPLLLAGCFDKTVTKRIRIIAKAEVGGKPVEGSTVMESTWRSRGSSMYIEERGEALILELGGQGTLYLLPIGISDDGMFNGSWSYALLRALVIPGQGTLADFPKIEAAAGRFPVKGLGSPKIKLMFVGFADERRKASIFPVRPEDFSTHFGDSVKLTGVEFEFTDEPVTKRLAERLPMLSANDPNNTFPKDPPGKLRAFVNLPFANKLTENHFLRRG